MEKLISPRTQPFDSQIYISGSGKTEFTDVTSFQNYVAAVEDPSAPRALKTLSDSLYGNLSEIYHFHKDRFLPKLEVCELNPQDLGDTFVSAEADLLLYVVYCKNKCRSESVYREFITFFEVRFRPIRFNDDVIDVLSTATV